MASFSSLEEERLEAGLLEVLIRGQGLGKFFFLHDQNRGAIGETPFLIKPL